MKKRKKGRKLSRQSGQRHALLKSLASSLILKEKIKSTEAKAKEVSVFVEKFITTAKKNDLASRRRLSQFFTQPVVKKMIQELGPRYKTRPGGYTRIIKLGPRQDDGARMAIIELLK
ncbi:MAG: 50S ribosomal protein L17 [Candidatus Nealsonbacteria bacterium]